MKRLIFLFFVFVSFALQAQTHVWVNANAIDTSGTGTYYSPIKYIGQIGKVASNNCIVHIMPGTYDENDNPNRHFPNLSGVDKFTNVKIVAEGPVTLKSTYNSTDAKYWFGKGTVEVRGITFNAITGNSTYTFSSLDNNITFKNCVFANMSNNRPLGTVTASGKTATFYNCAFALNATTGAIAGAGGIAWSAVFDHCTFKGTLYVVSSGTLFSTLTIKNSILQDIKIFNSNPVASSAVTLDNNVYYNVSDAASFTWTNSKSADPLITWNVNGYYNLSLSSPARNRTTEGYNCGVIEVGINPRN
jgi:hypothetical protein